MTLTRLSRPRNRINNGHSKNPFMLSKEYASTMIDFLIQREIVMIEEPKEDLSRKLKFGKFLLCDSERIRKMLGRGIQRVINYDFKN